MFQVSENLGIPGIFGCGMAGSKGTIMHVQWVLPVADPICPRGRGVAGKNEKIAACRGTSAQFFFRVGLRKFSCPNFNFPCRRVLPVHQ